jgi:hypothetical protein
MSGPDRLFGVHCEGQRETNNVISPLVDRLKHAGKHLVPCAASPVVRPGLSWALIPGRWRFRTSSPANWARADKRGGLQAARS